MIEESLFNKASKAWERGNKKRAFELFFEAANKDEPSAQNNLGFFYSEGIGTRKDNNKALYWFKRAVSNGEIYACINIAKMYQDAGNIKRAKMWLAKAVQGGDGDAALDLAKLYLKNKRRDNLFKAKSNLNKVINSRSTTEDSRAAARTLLLQLRNN
ncbi:MAG: tetratricopeptide repeat protein [Nitrospirota bacterium]